MIHTVINQKVDILPKKKSNATIRSRFIRLLDPWAFQIFNGAFYSASAFYFFLYVLYGFFVLYENHM